MMYGPTTNQLTDMAIKRIRHYEAFLEACGIRPLGGSELEYHFIPPAETSAKPAPAAATENAKPAEDLAKAAPAPADTTTNAAPAEAPAKPAPAPRENRGKPLVDDPAHPLGNTYVFGDSPLVESIKRDRIITDAKDNVIARIGEAVIGDGPKGRLWQYPGERYPSTVARATSSVKQIIASRAKEFGIDVTFGHSKDGRRIRSLQSNLSLWSVADKTPLFLASPGEDADIPSDFTLTCAQHIINAQQAMTALVSPTRDSFTRYDMKSARFGVGSTKADKATLAIYEDKGQYSPYLTPEELKKAKEAAETLYKRPAKSYYFEDRLASSEAEPAFAMLITLGGMVEGVKKTMTDLGLVDAHGQPDPAQMKAYIASDDFIPPFNTSKYWEVPNNFKMSVPNSHRDALTKLEESPLAKEIMGEEFHAAFCKAYEGLIPVAKGVMRR